ncbi:MAG TPA: hypothetical protein VM934_17525 [Pyrinomonadaceae bacterium]|jgi:hypothetical protein|nr:hypothetical protein [Pyrinomonadaceae bacterium]
MSDKEKSAELILKLYDLRREETMRKARNWFGSFNPESEEDVMNAVRGEHGAYYRMVTTYWDMACSFVNHGAIDEQMFNDANAEHFFVFSKIHPFIEQLRAATGSQYLPHLEKLVMRSPDAEKRLAHMREMSKKWAEMRASAEAGKAQTDAANA